MRSRMKSSQYTWQGCRQGIELGEAADWCCQFSLSEWSSLTLEKKLLFIPHFSRSAKSVSQVRRCHPAFHLPLNVERKYGCTAFSHLLLGPALLPNLIFLTGTKSSPLYHGQTSDRVRYEVKRGDFQTAWWYIAGAFQHIVRAFSCLALLFAL